MNNNVNKKKTGIIVGIAILILVVVLVLLKSGVLSPNAEGPQGGDTPVVVDGPGEEPAEEPGEEPEITVPAPEPSRFEGDENADYGNEAFLVNKDFAIYDGCLFYSEKINMSDDRIIKLNLATMQREELVLPGTDSFDGFVINPAGYLVAGISRPDSRMADDNNNAEMNAYDVHDFSLAESIFAYDEYNSSYDGPILYKGKIVSTTGEIGINSDSINIHDLKGGLVRTVFEGSVHSTFGIVDDAIYYCPWLPENPEALGWGDDDKNRKYGNAVMRYDMKSGTAEKVFEFEIREEADLNKSYGYRYYDPYPYFSGRCIIIQNQLASFAYTNIDNIAPKEIDFDAFTGRKDGWAKNIPGDDGELYFAYRNSDARDTWGQDRKTFGKIQLFRAGKDAVEEVKMEKEHFGDEYWDFLCIADGYIYFMHTNQETDAKEITREKLQ